MLRLIVVKGMKPVFIGIAAGVVGALLLSRLILSLLFQVTARDPLTYVSVAVILAATAVLAWIVPARQACART